MKWIVPALLVLAAAGCSPYQVADPARPPLQTAYAAHVECAHLSGLGSSGVTAVFGAAGGIAEGMAWAQNGGPERIDSCMQAKGFASR